MTYIDIPIRMAKAAFDKSDDLASYRDMHGYRDISINTTALPNGAIETLVAEADDSVTDEKKVAARLRSILDARTTATIGTPKSLVNLADILPPWVDKNCGERGWMIEKKQDRPDLAWLVTKVKYHDGDAARQSSPFVSISLMANEPGSGAKESGNRKSGRTEKSISVYSSDMFTEPTMAGEKRRRRTIMEIMESEGMFPATEQDLAAHDANANRFEAILSLGFAQQYILTGAAQEVGYGYRGAYEAHRTRVIHDIAPDERRPSHSFETVWDSDRRDVGDSSIVRPVPTHSTLRVFDLARQITVTADTRDMAEHVYDKSLREKLVLPDTHRDLLDVLTTDLDDYADDIIEGKSAGNVILSQGRPGVGKTLTAEVYAELVERPLYSIHSGSLGTNAKDVRENLEAIFKRSTRWNAVLLLDEADVFVIERGQSVEQNAIVAEFLRTLEYFKGLMFMTTNRSDSIDDAILSRCAAIIAYTSPSPSDAARLWKVQVETQGATQKVGDAMIQSLVSAYPHLTGRDIKMVLKMALKIAAKSGSDPTMETFERCLLFRGLSAAQDAS